MVFRVFAITFLAAPAMGASLPFGAEFSINSQFGSILSSSGYNVWYGGNFATCLNPGDGVSVPGGLTGASFQGEYNYSQFGYSGGGYVPGVAGYIAFSGPGSRYGWIEVVTTVDFMGTLRSFAYADSGSIVTGLGGIGNPSVYSGILNGGAGIPFAQGTELFLDLDTMTVSVHVPEPTFVASLSVFVMSFGRWRRT